MTRSKKLAGNRSSQLWICCTLATITSARRQSSRLACSASTTTFGSWAYSARMPRSRRNGGRDGLQRPALLDQKIIDTEIGGALRLPQPLVSEDPGRDVLEELADLQHPALLLPQPPAHLRRQRVPLRPVALVAELLQVERHILTPQRPGVDVVPMAEQLQPVNRPVALLAPLAGKVFQPSPHRDRQRSPRRYCHSSPRVAHGGIAELLQARVQSTDTHAALLPQLVSSPPARHVDRRRRLAQ